MNLDIQFKIRSNKLYKEYLRTHSYWYKFLTLEPNRIQEFENEVKHFYKLTPVDRISKAMDTLEIINSFMSALK